MYAPGAVLDNLVLPERYKDTPIVSRRSQVPIERGMVIGCSSQSVEMNDAQLMDHSEIVIDYSPAIDLTYAGIALSDSTGNWEEYVKIAYCGMIAPVLFDPEKFLSGAVYSAGALVQPNDAGDAAGLASIAKLLTPPTSEMSIIIIGALACSYIGPTPAPSEPVLLPVYLSPFVLYRPATLA
jgi:hypothetical protein